MTWPVRSGQVLTITFGPADVDPGPGPAAAVLPYPRLEATGG
jgi:hypothetical protein